MENNYKRPTRYERLKENFKGFAKIGLLLYVVSGCNYINATKTGHQSADLATGRSQPTKLEKTLINFVAETFEVEIPQKYK